MLVICPKCAASYNVPDEKIPETGARTKCATCGTSFRIEKVPHDLVASDHSGDDPFAPVDISSPEPSAPDDASDLFGSGDDLSSGYVSDDLTPTMVFDPSQVDTRGHKAVSPVPSKTAYPDFDWPDQAETSLPGLVPDTTSNQTADPFSASLFQPALDESQGRHMLGRKPQRTSSGGVNVSRTISKQRRTITFYVLMALVAGGGGYVAIHIDTYAAIDWQEVYFDAIETVGLPSPRPVVKPIVIGASVHKIYEETTMAGDKLLIVEGSVQNLCDTPQEQLSATVTFSDNAGTEVTSGTAYAGNVLSTIQLKTLPLAQVFAMHARPLGTAVVNTNVQPEASLPFQIVFSPMPSIRDKISVSARSSQSPVLPTPIRREAQSERPDVNTLAGVVGTPASTATSSATNSRAIAAAPEAVSTP